jgi:hypothetical protein
MDVFIFSNLVQVWTVASWGRKALEAPFETCIGEVTMDLSPGPTFVSHKREESRKA